MFVAASMLVAAPVAAQSDSASSAQDLECAIWASYIAGTSSDDERVQGAIAVAGYFIGRYEGATRTDIDEAMFARSLDTEQAELAALESRCQQRALGYSKRMGALGRRIAAAAKAKGK